MWAVIKLSALLRGRAIYVMPKTDETPDPQFVVRLKNYLAKWLELSESNPGWELQHFGGPHSQRTVHLRLFS